MPLLKDLIEIPDHLDTGQFVLKLTEGITDPEETVNQYVVTEDLKKSFDNALGFIGGALRENSSRASYLHGSFGSGKSHFMAILHLILQGNVHARRISMLAEPIEKANKWASGKKFLLVPFYMIGAANSETGILGGYVDYMKRTHPDAPTPGVYRAEALFTDAVRLRETMGDTAFFSGLNKSLEKSRWGDLGKQWDATRFDSAIDKEHGDDERSLLSSALIKSFFSAYATQASHKTDEFIGLGKGLGVISRHAAALGYDGVIFFLDELILWLAGRAVDLNFVQNECTKLVKLVESEDADRPIPIISFVARQRDLRDLIGEGVPGAHKMNFKDLLKWWEGRFHEIKLEDRNLPMIANQRVLKCKSKEARAELDASFDSFYGKIRTNDKDSLQTSDYDRAMFRLVYPFSPALIKTLIAVSSLLQRERTALRVMMQLLVDHRDELKVGDVIPVGALFDVVAYGQDAFNTEMKEHFENAKKLYTQKLVPLIERKTGITYEQYNELPLTDSRRRMFRNDDRLAKTLLLSALVPEVESLRGLTAHRLAALNYGTIKTPAGGDEGAEVLERVRDWAKSVNAIRLSDDRANPSITVQLSDVDTDMIIQRADLEDNDGNRVRLIRKMLFASAGIVDATQENTFGLPFNWQWRNTARMCGVLFKNVRILGSSSFMNDDDNWRLIIDYPFDSPPHGPKDDVSQLQEFKSKIPAGTKTICWIPAHFSTEASEDLGKLVRLNHILSHDRFNDYVSHLSAQDRSSAKASLESQQSTLHQTVSEHIEAAYGLNSNSRNSLDPVHTLDIDDRFVSLANGLALRPPARPNFRDAIQDLLGQALEYEFPGAPHFQEDTRSLHVKKVYEAIRGAINVPNERVEIEPTLRKLVRGIANPLQLGELAPDKSHFALSTHWKNHFIRKRSEAGGKELTVDTLRTWIDEPKKMGLSTELQNLIILMFAEQSDYAFYIHGGPVSDVSIARLPNCDLRQESPPNPLHWPAAYKLVQNLFDSTVSELCNASNLAKLANKVREASSSAPQSVTQYRKNLIECLEILGVDSENAPRVKTADAARLLLSRIQSAKDNHVLLESLATFQVTTTTEAIQHCIAKAHEMNTSLDTSDIRLIMTAQNVDTIHQVEAAKLLESVTHALTQDEHVTELQNTLRQAKLQAIRLLTPPKEKAAPKQNAPIATKGRRVVQSSGLEKIGIDEAKQKLAALGSELKANQTIVISMNWTIEEDFGS